MRFQQTMLLFALTIGCVNGQVGIVQRVMASEKAALQKKPIHPFWDFSALNLTQRIALLDHTKAVNEAQQYVDWTLLKDRYLIASFDRERRLGKRPARTRKRRRKNDWNVAEDARVDSNTSDKDALELKKAETLSSLTSLIADAAKNAGFDNIQEQIQEAQNRVQPRQDTTAPVGTTAPVVTDDILVTQSPVATPIPGATEAPVGGTQAPVGTDDATTTEAPVGTEAPAQAPAGTEAPVATDDATSTQPPQGGNDNGSPDEDIVIIPNYKYDEGNCPDAGDSAAAVPCAADLNLDVICDKYQEGSSFTACWEACIPSFCCIHDAPPATNLISPSCNEDVNCAQYACCYIVWWKLHDTVGPATQLQIEQNADDFFDLPADALESDVTGLVFFRDMLFHHFDDSTEIIRLGTVQVNESYSFFESDLIFLNSTYWNTTI